MKYDFTSMIDRRGKDAIAVDGIGGIKGMTPDAPKLGFDPIPMWVADMNFPTVPTIQEEIIKRVQHPFFGYFMPSQEYYDSIIRWQTTRNGVKDLTQEDIGYENGVLGGVVSTLKAFAAPGDNVLINSPTYIGFTMVVENNGYHIVHSPLKKDEHGTWRMDFEDMDAKIKANKIHVAIFCNPHNPCGRAWERWEIEKAMEVFKANDVIVIADEIWSDIMLNGHKHIPTQSVSEDARNRTAAFYAPSKTFSTSGLVGSYHIIYNKYLRDRITSESGKSDYNSMNVLCMHALIGAYKPEGYEWVDELNEVLSSNINYAYDYIQKHFEGVEVSKPEGTYMMFLDCGKWLKAHGKTIKELEKMGWDVGVEWQDGEQFVAPNHIRMNLALPFSRVKEAFDRLDQYVFNRDPNLKEPESTHLTEGSVMEDFTYNTPFASGIRFSDTVKKAKKTAVVFLRYYGCTLCQYDIQQMAAHYDELTSGGGQVLVVLQSDPAVVAESVKEGDLPFDLVCDPKASLYIRNAVWPAESLVEMGDDEASKKKLEKVHASGLKHGKYEGSELQLPAVFIVDSDRKVVYAHYAKKLGDMPDVSELAKLLA